LKAFKQNRRSPRAVHGLALILFGLGSAPAFAYLDPGSGSMLLQVILGGFAALGVAMKLYWHKVKAALGFGKSSEANEDSA
jgi:hypothetical protein